MNRQGFTSKHALMANKEDHYSNSIFGLNDTKMQKGFTLIEVMIVVFILAILAAIAVPSYRHYIVVNAERDTQAKMLQLQLELERWRASALTYKNFKPKRIDANGNANYDYADVGTNTIVNIPASSGDNYTYRITLVDGGTSKSLVAGAGVDNVTGRTWKMLAVPNPTKYVKNGHNMMLTSSGVRCMTTSALTVGLKDCGNDSQVW
ncbi:type IV pilin protein [Psychrobacter sp. JB385]|uniref:type IV pilin protein n=1 Tax=Psychrobacter sp. JB385 TaxID=1434841 RepID=UPI00097E96FA|nr:prepilin-type N-terminal cleavage/methylation domain-containing protein [Psychrobacter sp. JB385]SJN44127.1 Type IV pilin PilA [Psychrobacter sp. JB385]